MLKSLVLGILRWGTKVGRLLLETNRYLRLSKGRKAKRGRLW